MRPCSRGPRILAKTGYYGADPTVMKGLKAVIEPGLDPVELGRKVLEAVERNDLYIIPYSEFREELTERLNRVLAVLPGSRRRSRRGGPPGWIPRRAAERDAASRT